MKRIIPLALIALTLTGGVALADRDHGRGRDNRNTVRDHRQNDRRNDNRRHDNRRYDNRRNDNHRNDRVVRVQRARPTFRNNRFYFAGGHYRDYQRPVIQYRYRDYNRRPALIVENIQPVAGYVWVQGGWQWDGYEWQWLAGHYEVDSSYQEPYYNGGISVQGSWNF